jgi:hypothetical protein
MNQPQTKRWRIVRRCLIGVAAFLTLIAALYTEELWRGKRAWENCQRTLEAKGIKFDQKADNPPPVPDDQNVFGVPEMRQWFLDGGASNLSGIIDDVVDFDTDSSRPTNQIVLADVVIGYAGSNPPAGFTALTYGDPKTMAELRKLLKDAVGPYFTDPYGIPHMLRRPEEIPPAKILLLCQTAPTVGELEQLLPDAFSPEGSVNSAEQEKDVKIEPAGNGSYQVTTQVPGTVADLLARLAVLEPKFAAMRQALHRPYIRMLGEYPKTGSDLLPIAGIYSPLARILGALAQCHLLQGRPEEALRDLALSQDLCRIVDEVTRGTYGALPTLLHETVTTVDINALGDGLSRHAWREPQLAAMQEQLKNINFVSDLKQVMSAGPAQESDFFPNVTAFNLGQMLFPVSFELNTNAWTWLKATVVGQLIPRGWVYQNMVQLANGYLAIGESSDSAGQIVDPKKVDAVGTRARAYPSPYNYLAMRYDPMHSKWCRGTARSQTRVHQAILACALERDYLARGEYPETLAALVPQFLDQIPNDVIGGQPPHYRRADDGKFILYSIGWSGRDGGGVPAKTEEAGDWVWPIK